MLEFLGAFWWLIVTLGILVTFHELGHFWVARRSGVRVLRFSVGFGPPLWRRAGADGTEYAIGAIPLGGYVSMLDERESGHPLSPEERARAFNTQPVRTRMAIVAAGPLFNLVLAVLAFWAMFVVGKPDHAPVVGRAEGLAAEAGLRAGDRLRAVDGAESETWTHIVLSLTRAALDRRDVELRVEDGEGRSRELRLPLSRLREFRDDGSTLSQLGIHPRHLIAGTRIGRVSAGSPAAEAGLRPGDRVLAVDGETVADFEALSERLQRVGGEGELRLLLERDGQRLTVPVRPRLDPERGRFLIGISPAPAEYDALLRLGPLAAVPAALTETWHLTEATLGMLWRMVAGVASTGHLSGPITIAQLAHSSARLGLGWFLFFLGLVSLSLAILNLLPIPLLDGGHLLFLAIEGLRGRPLSERVLAAGQYLGLLVIAGLIALALYNDIMRLLS